MVLNIDNKYAANEELVTRVSISYRNLVITSATIFCIVPGTKQFVAYLTDNVTPTTYLAPFRDMYVEMKF